VRAGGTWPRPSYLSSRRPRAPAPSLSVRARVWHPVTRTYVRLLGPCFKTGRLGTFRQHPDHASAGSEPGHAARGTSKLSSRAAHPVLELRQGTGRDCAHVGGASVKRPARCRQAVTAGHPVAKPEPAHLPATRCPGHLADADQHGADEAWPTRCRAAQVISAPATLRPSGSLLAISSPFNSLFKVLFIFPSRYLFAIGLLPVFSFRWNLPPVLG